MVYRNVSKRMVLYALILINCSSVFAAVAPIILEATRATSYSKAKRPWLSFTYIAGDNTLAPYVDLDLQEMIKGANANVHVLAFVSTNNEKGKISRKYIVTPQGLIQDGPDLVNADSGNVATARAALEWALEFQSDYVWANWWDHGSGPVVRSIGSHNSSWHMMPEEICMGVQSGNPEVGPRGVCFDDATGSYLSDNDLRALAKQIFDKRGKKTAIFSFDACLMSHIELAYELGSWVDFMVASQETIGGTGFQYAWCLDSLKSKAVSPAKFCKGLVDSYDKCYRVSSQDYTFSSTDLSKIQPLVDNVNQVSVALIKFLAQQKKHEVDKVITKAAFSDSAIRFEEADYIDLYNLYLNIYNLVAKMNLSQPDATALQKLLKDGMYLVRTVVTNNVTGPKHSLVRGLSIYMPKTIHPSYKQNWWASNSQWYTFLKAYTKIKA